MGVVHHPCNIIICLTNCKYYIWHFYVYFYCLHTLYKLKYLIAGMDKTGVFVLILSISIFLILQVLGDAFFCSPWYSLVKLCVFHLKQFNSTGFGVHFLVLAPPLTDLVILDKSPSIVSLDFCKSEQWI